MKECALICAWFDVAQCDRAGFLDFHSREHLPERLAIPGFRRGRRFGALAAHSDYFIMYEVDALAVLASPAYLARLNSPTGWTRRSLPTIRNSRRLALRLERSSGDGRGTAVMALDFRRLQPEVMAAVIACVDALATAPGIVAVHAGLVDEAASNLDTVERTVLGSPMHEAGIVLVVEAVDEAALQALAGGQLVAILATHNAVVGTYQLEMSMESDPERRSEHVPCCSTNESY